MNNSTGQATDTIVESSTGRANASITRNKKITKSKKSGVLFPVSRLHRFLRRSSPKNRVSVSASIYIAAVMEYLCAEVLELSGNAARDNRRTRVTPRHIFLAVTIDEELKKLLKDVTISNGGVLPNIHPNLIKTKKPVIDVIQQQPISNFNGAAKKINKKKTVPKAIEQAQPLQAKAVANVIVKKSRGAKPVQSDTAITC